MPAPVFPGVFATTPEAMRLLIEGADAFADLESRGMRVDLPYLDNAIVETEGMMRAAVETMKSSEEWRHWRKHFGERADLNSPTQIARVLFDVLGFEVDVRDDAATTDGDRRKTDKQTLEQIDTPFVKSLLEWRKLTKLHGTYLLAVRREVGDDGFLHPHFYLNFVHTFRTSSGSPNFQNIPIRDPIQGKMIRRAFIPRSDEHVICEIDYAALEFRGAACFWTDPDMIAYASDPSLDIHRDMAAECYLLDTDEVTKGARGVGKNSYVFPRLFGSYWRAIAGNLWIHIERQQLKTKSGVGLYEHLAQHGITELGDGKEPAPGGFAEHIRGVERRFDERFSHWASEKEVWWQQYLQRGWFELKTGFVCRGSYSRMNLMNTPIQGPCCHWMLWSLIRLNMWLKQHGMKSMIIGQIHDSIVLDLHVSEIDDVLHNARRIMCEEVRRHWEWIVTPLEVEAEIAETNWYEKKPVEIAA